MTNQPVSADKRCGGCVFAVTKNGVMYCANGKVFKPGTPTIWEDERIIEATGTCGKWIKAFAPAQPKAPKPLRRNPKKKQRREKPTPPPPPPPPPPAPDQPTLFDL